MLGRQRQWILWLLSSSDSGIYGWWNLISIYKIKIRSQALIAAGLNSNSSSLLYWITRNCRRKHVLGIFGVLIWQPQSVHSVSIQHWNAEVFPLSPWQYKVIYRIGFLGSWCWCVRNGEGSLNISEEQSMEMGFGSPVEEQTHSTSEWQHIPFHTQLPQTWNRKMTQMAEVDCTH